MLSCTNTSLVPFVSPCTRWASADANATQLPAPESDGALLTPVASVAAGGLDTLARRTNEQPVPATTTNASTTSPSRRDTMTTLRAQRLGVYRWSIGT